MQSRRIVPPLVLSALLAAAASAQTRTTATRLTSPELAGRASEVPSRQAGRTVSRPRASGFERAGADRWRVENAGHGLLGEVDRSGLEVRPGGKAPGGGPGGDWVLRIETLAFGRGEDLTPLRSAGVRGDARRVEIARTALTEWFRNGPRGIEQGWDLPGRPPGPAGEPVRIRLRFSGDLSLRLHPDGSGGKLVDAAGAGSARYEGLVAWDAEGRRLDARLVPAPGGVDVLVHDDGAAYPITVDPHVSAFVWTYTGPFVGGEIEAGDFDGDGFGDLVTTYWGPIDGSDVVGFYGSPGGMASEPDFDIPNSTYENTVFDPVAVDFLSARPWASGDVNGDGFDDLFVSIDTEDPNTHFQVTFGAVFHGSASGIPPGAMPDYDAVHGVTFCGDLDGDGYDDAFANGGICSGGPSGLSTSATWSSPGIRGHGDVDGDGYDDLLGGDRYADPGGLTDAGIVELYLGGVAGPSSTSSWTHEGDQAGGEVTGFFAGDVNGDGYDDVIVTADSSYMNPSGTRSKAWLFLGGPAGPAGSEAWSYEPSLEHDPFSIWFGDTVNDLGGPVGDLNGDGYDDVALLAISSVLFCPDGEDILLVFLGCSAGLQEKPAFLVRSGSEHSIFDLKSKAAGDTDGDGYPDLLVGSYWSFDLALFTGAPSALAAAESWTEESGQSGAELGTSVSAALDVNGDGYTDALVGAPGHDGGEADEGAAHVYLGSASGLSATPDWSFEPDQAGAALGSAVSSAGDVNGDGYDDALVGAPGWDGGEADEGRAYLFLGSASGLSATPDWTYEPDQAGAALGGSVARAGDVNGDGFLDLIVGADGYDGGEAGEGRALVFHGSATGPGAAPDWTVEPDQAGAALGSSVAGAGDVDGDGYDDVIVGAHLWDGGESDEGRASLFRGSASGLAASAAWSFEPDQADAHLGASVAGAGDVNGDALSDVVVGAPGFDDDETDEGRAYVFHGSGSGLSATADWTADGDATGAALGSAVASAGDVDLDGTSDLVLGAPLWADGESGEGAAFGFYGSATGLPAGTELTLFTSWQVEGGEVDAHLGSSLAAAGDTNGDSFGEVLVGVPGWDGGVGDQGRALLFGGNGGAAAPARRVRQLRLDGTTPVALQGAVAGRRFVLEVEAELDASGSPSAWLEWEVEAAGAPFDGVGVESGTPQAVTGSPQTFQETVVVPIGASVQPLGSSEPVHWRVRIATDSIGQLKTPWFSLPGNAASEHAIRLRAGGDPRPRKKGPLPGP